jgi:UDP-N-acetylglucosamine acyltransferase
MITQSLPHFLDCEQENISQSTDLFDCRSRDEDSYDNILGNKVHPTAVVNWSAISIGTGNVIGPYACLGMSAQHVLKKSSGAIQIGNNNIFREHATVHLPTCAGLGTLIGDRNYFMVNAHIAHDCLLEDDIVMCNNAAIAGHVHVMKGAVLGLNSSVHQFQVLGSWSMIGMNSCVPKSTVVQPGQTYFGVPVRKVGKNKVGLSRNDVNDSQLEQEFKRFSDLKTRSRRVQ